jgi:glycerol-3-phosphate dehydrogenase
LSTRTNITNFSGIRAHLSTDDFAVGPVSGCDNAYEAVGIESPGLSSAPAVAADLCRMITENMKWNRKTNDRIVPPLPGKKPFSAMTAEERAEAVRKNPLYGNIICRCETVTEAEIRQAVRRPVGARTIDGVKRRTRAGMGRCQGGFCLPRVAAIIAEETGCSLSDVTKDGGNSRILADTLDAFLKGDGSRE